MLFQDRMDRLGDVAAHLPFPLEDYDAVNRTFCRWAERRGDGDLETLEVWLYCYVQRYVLVRFLRMPYAGAGEADRVIGDVFTRLRAQFDRVADPSRFTHFVSVACRNAFRNGLRRLYQRDGLDADALPADGTEPALDEPDRALIRHTVARAIDGLPGHVGHIARMRLLEGHSYRFIAGATGHPLPTVRAYVSKAVSRLRRDAGVRALGALFDYAPP
jgi:DNA-directed RNA polymerase specialized sigma24 family protein